MEFVPFIIIATAFIINFLTSLHVFKDSELPQTINEELKFQTPEERSPEASNVVSLNENRKLREISDLLVRRLEIDKEASSLTEAKHKARDLIFWTREVNDTLGRD